MGASTDGGDIWEVAAPAFVDLSALLQRAVAPVRQLPLSAPAERPAARHAHNISRRLSSSQCCWPRGRPAGAGVRGAVCDGVAHLCGGLAAVAVPRYWQEKLVAQQVQLILAGSGRPAAALKGGLRLGLKWPRGRQQVVSVGGCDRAPNIAAAAPTSRAAQIAAFASI
jgi:hypothetical protein